MQSLREDSKKEKNTCFYTLVVCFVFSTPDRGGRERVGKKGRERHLACVCLCVRRTRTRIYIHSCAYTKPFPHYSLLCKLKNKKESQLILHELHSVPCRYEGTLNVASSEECLKKKKYKQTNKKKTTYFALH